MTASLWKKPAMNCFSMKMDLNARYHVLDFFRGIVVISMLVYHTVWDLVNIAGFSWDWYDSAAAYVWQQSICWSFILLSGFCWSLGSHHLRRGLIVTAASALVSAVTIFIMPDEGVIFGVLTLIGISMLIMIPFDMFVELISGGRSNILKGTVRHRLVRIRNAAVSAAGTAIFAILFFITRNAGRGELGFESFKIAALPDSLYINLVTAFFGFPGEGFYSSDYFPLIPWLFLFILGYFIFRLFAHADLIYVFSGKDGKNIVSFMGRHSLIIYLLHQPVIYAVIMLIEWLF